MMASKARLFGDDTALSAILASNDPRDQKCLGRQVRHFDHELWQSACESIVLHGNPGNFFFPKRGDSPCPYSNWQPPPRRSKTNATADLSACNGTSAILGQHKACPDRDDSERTRSFTTPSVPLSHDAENTFLTGKKTPPFILGKQLRDPSMDT